MCEETLDLLESFASEPEVIRRTLKRPRQQTTVNLNTSTRAMETIRNTLRQAEEEEKRKKALEEEPKRKERAIRDSINKEMIRTSAEELVGKTWNAKGLFDRIL